MENEKLLLVSYVVNKKIRKTKRAGIEHYAQQRSSDKRSAKKATRDLLLRPYEGRSRCHGYDIRAFYNQIQIKTLNSTHWPTFWMRQKLMP